MRKIVLLNSLILISYYIHACDCLKFSQEDEWSDSEIVFIGKIIESYEEYFKIQALEVFKNNTFTEEVIFQVEINSCSINPSKGELWLIYGELENENLEVSICGYSKSLSFFSSKSRSKILPPPPLNYTNEEYEIVKSLYEARIADQLFFTINGLRIQKLQGLIKTQELKIKTENEGNAKDEFHAIIYILVLLVLSSLVLNFFVLRKLRKLSK